MLLLRYLLFHQTDLHPAATEEDIDAYLERLDSEMGDTEQTAKELVDEAVFMKTFIPRSLGEVHDFENEQARVLTGEGETAFVNSVLELQAETR